MGILFRSKTEKKQLGIIDKAITGARRRTQEKLERLNVESIVSLVRGRCCSSSSSSSRAVEICGPSTNTGLNFNFDVMEGETVKKEKSGNDEEFFRI